MITGKMFTDETVVYDLPKEIKTAEQFNSLIYGYNENPAHRDELQGQPLLLGINGPMFNGYSVLKSTGPWLFLSEHFLHVLAP
mgnify:FL=1